MNHALYARYLENLIEGISSCAEIYAKIAEIERREDEWSEIRILAYSTYDVYEGFFSAGMLRRGFPVVVLSEALRQKAPDFRLDDDFFDLLADQKVYDEPTDASFPIAVLRNVLGAIPSELYDACFWFALNQDEEGLAIAKNSMGRLAGGTEDAWNQLQEVRRYTDDKLIEIFEQSLMECHRQLRSSWRRLSTEFHRNEQIRTKSAA